MGEVGILTLNLQRILIVTLKKVSIQLAMLIYFLPSSIIID